jgi:hypothetical protein
MPSGDRRVPLETLRTAARERVAGSSLRRVAAESGFSHDALARFVNGSQPYGRTVAKLLAWHIGETDEVERLRQENAELRKRLAECEEQLPKW